MQFTLHSEFPQQMKNDWDSLVKRSVSDVPFLHFEFLETWWSTRGGGEWPQAELAIITAEEDDQLIGVAPMFRAEKDGQWGYFILGTIEVFDYLDLIVEPGNLEKFTQGLLTFLNSDNVPDWDFLDFSNLLHVSATLTALKTLADENDLVAEEDVLQPAPHILLEGDWETYLAGIKKKQRHEIRRKMRRMVNAEVGHHWYLVTDETKLESEMDAFLDMMMQDTEKNSFMTEEMRVHMQNMARCVMKAGMLHLSFLVIDGKKAAGKFMFMYNNVLWGYNSCVDYAVMAYSPGWVLMGYLLQWATKEGYREFDFMRGNEQYKYRFGAVDRFVKRIRLSRQSG